MGASIHWITDVRELMRPSERSLDRRESPYGADSRPDLGRGVFSKRGVRSMAQGGRCFEAAISFPALRPLAATARANRNMRATTISLLLLLCSALAAAYTPPSIGPFIQTALPAAEAGQWSEDTLKGYAAGTYNAQVHMFDGCQSLTSKVHQLCFPP